MERTTVASPRTLIRSMRMAMARGTPVMGHYLWVVSLSLVSLSLVSLSLVSLWVVSLSLVSP